MQKVQPLPAKHRVQEDQRDEKKLHFPEARHRRFDSYPKPETARSRASPSSPHRSFEIPARIAGVHGRKHRATPSLALTLTSGAVRLLGSRRISVEVANFGVPVPEPWEEDVAG